MTAVFPVSMRDKPELDIPMALAIATSRMPSKTRRVRMTCPTTRSYVVNGRTPPLFALPDALSWFTRDW